MTILDVVVVGAGQAGLGVSYYLQRAGLDHVVFERGRIGEAWLSQRWDSFRLNTPNEMNGLPGLPYDGADAEGFASPVEFAGFMRRYVDRFGLPVQTGVQVVSVGPAEPADQFVVRTVRTELPRDAVHARAIVVASGFQCRPVIPAIGDRIPGDICQLHAASYRRAVALPPGAVVIAGSGQTGCQIAEDLLAAGRKVYLCSSRVGRARRRYRGRDTTGWMRDIGLFDMTYASLPDKTASREKQPQVSGLGPRGHTVSLQQLARQGAVILGRLQDVAADTLGLGDDAASNVRFADQFSQQLKDTIDAHLVRAGLALPPLEDDRADAPDPEAACASPIRSLSLREARVSTVIWATGFRSDLGWVHLPAFGVEGDPVHQEGISPVRGLYFIGAPWLRKAKSGIIAGIEEDAEFIARAVVTQLAADASS
jgi:putative flavoprotein involved in K+ transport